MADRAGFEGFYRARQAGLIRACTLVTLDPSSAEDVAAEAFARLWARWGAIQDEDHAGGYVYKTAMRLCVRRARRLRHEPLGLGDRPGRDHLEPLLIRVDVFRAMRSLPLRQRQAVVLRDWAGYETHRVAAMLGMRESTVRVHLARGRAALRTALKVEEEERS
ncbi:MAG TPA: sigma-70 family RNA polymerase sigma factor [Actinomycetota bacterium]|jgi:RNA polymerase sigma factor (sigma-70 family)